MDPEDQPTPGPRISYPTHDELTSSDSPRLRQLAEAGRQVRARLSPDLLDRARQEVEASLLGGERKYTRAQVAELTGVDSAHSGRLWTAMGFASSTDPDAVIYTDADVDALRELAELAGLGVLDANIEGPMARATAQAMSRMARWQVTLMIQHMGEELLKGQPSENDDEFDEDYLVETLRSSTATLLPLLQSLQEHVWRRHLAAAVDRAIAESTQTGETQTLAIGFADMVGYTSLTRRIDVEGLTGLLEDFESTATRVIAGHRGWIIKNLGDEVMFAASNANDAAAIGLALQEEIKGIDDLPMIRVGMAYGAVLLRFGDAFGSVVNIAARLTSAAKPGTILVGNNFAEALTPDDSFEIKSVRPLKVRGYSKLRPYLLRRARSFELLDEAESE